MRYANLKLLREKLKKIKPLEFPVVGFTLLENDQKRIFYVILWVYGLPEFDAGYYVALNQIFVLDHQHLLGCSVVRQILPYSHHLWALILLQTGQKCTLCVITCVYLAVV